MPRLLNKSPGRLYQKVTTLIGLSSIFFPIRFTIDRLFPLQVQKKKSRQNAENKQTFDLSGKFEISEKNSENKQTFGFKGKN